MVKIAGYAGKDETKVPFGKAFSPNPSQERLGASLALLLDRRL